MENGLNGVFVDETWIWSPKECHKNENVCDLASELNKLDSMSVQYLGQHKNWSDNAKQCDEFLLLYTEPAHNFHSRCMCAHSNDVETWW